ncbi:hypothetical protein Cantr_10648 [Candida viswanathii]|uniref:Uncharacterized protein n=1 Tax=Candida viswanathii TaxID=5486 RepID=A0A367YEC5_9ASCO|nr:hypothetical protein Cantr_10648 [Candida viswanathii]
MSDKIVYQPADLLKLRHLKQYDDIKLTDLLVRHQPPPQQPRRKHFPSINAVQATATTFYPISAFILVHHHQEYQYYPQPQYVSSSPVPITSPGPVSPHNLYVNPSFPFYPQQQPQLYVTPLSPISPLKSAVPVAIPVIQLDPGMDVPIGGVPLQSFYLPPPPPQQQPHQPQFRYASPISPQNKENFLKVSQTMEDVPDIKEVPDIEDGSAISGSCSASSSASSSDIIIQI